MTPIWVGGESGRSLRRARFGDAWYLIGSNNKRSLDTLPRLSAVIERLRKVTAQAGRDPDSVSAVYRVKHYAMRCRRSRPTANGGRSSAAMPTPSAICARCATCGSASMWNCEATTKPRPLPTCAGSATRSSRGPDYYARPRAIRISTLIASRPLDSNCASRAVTSARTARRSVSESATYACGMDPTPVSIGSQ